MAAVAANDPGGPARPGGRPRTTDMRRFLDSLFYVLRTSCQWRHLPPPPAFLPWTTVYGYFRAFLNAGVWEAMRHRLVVMLRESAGRDPSPTAAVIDSQSVKTTESGGPRGYDAAKKVTGRKRHIAVDTQGLLLGVVVHAASIQGADGAQAGCSGASSRCIAGCGPCSPTAATTACRPCLPASCSASSCSSSAAPGAQKASWCCRAAGWRNEHSPGSDAGADCPGITSTCQKSPKPWLPSP